MFLYILTITILFYSSLLHYYKLIFSSFHITSFLQHTNLYFHFLISFCQILNPPHIWNSTFYYSSHRHAKKTANKLFSQLHYFKNYPLFLINAFSSFSVFFSIFILLNCGSLSLSLSLLQPQRFRLSFLLCAPFVYFLLFHFIIWYILIAILLLYFFNEHVIIQIPFYYHYVL